MSVMNQLVICTTDNKYIMFKVVLYKPSGSKATDVCRNYDAAFREEANPQLQKKPQCFI